MPGQGAKLSQIVPASVAQRAIAQSGVGKKALADPLIFLDAS